MGITDDHQGPFPGAEFGVVNQYSGPYNGMWLNIFAGGEKSEDGGSFTRAGIRIYEYPADPKASGPETYLGEFSPPNARTWVKLVSVDANSVVLQREDGSRVTFDLQTRRFS